VTHEERLRDLSARRRAVERGRIGEIWLPQYVALTQAVDAGAEALRIAREGIERYTENGGCSNCGGVPHSTTCMIGQFAALLATEVTR
jgi:hypothetical protein